MKLQPNSKKVYRYSCYLSVLCHMFMSKQLNVLHITIAINSKTNSRSQTESPHLHVNPTTSHLARLPIETHSRVYRVYLYMKGGLHGQHRDDSADLEMGWEQLIRCFQNYQHINTMIAQPIHCTHLYESFHRIFVVIKRTTMFLFCVY